MNLLPPPPGFPLVYTLPWPGTLTEHEALTHWGNHVCRADALVTVQDSGGVLNSITATVSGTVLWVAPVGTCVTPGVSIVAYLHPDVMPTVEEPTRQNQNRNIVGEFCHEGVATLPEVSGEGLCAHGEATSARALPQRGLPLSEGMGGAAAAGAATAGADPRLALAPFPANGTTTRKTYHLDKAEIEEVEKLADAHGLRDHRHVTSASRLLSIAIRFFWGQPFAVREHAIDAIAGTPSEGTPAPTAPDGT